MTETQRPKTAKIRARRRFAGFYDVETDFGTAIVMRQYDGAWRVAFPEHPDAEDFAGTFRDAKDLLVAWLDAAAERENRYAALDAEIAP